MDRLLTAFMKNPFSFDSIFNLLESVKKILDAGNEISPSVFKRLLVEENGVVQLLMKDSMDSRTRVALLDLLSLLIQRNLIPWGLLSDEIKIRLCHCLLTMLRRNDDLKTFSLILPVMRSRELLILLCRPQLLELFCEALTYLYTPKISDKPSRAHLWQLFANLLQIQMDRFCTEPTASNLRTALTLVNFGFMLIKLDPDDCTPSLHMLSAHLNQLSTHPKSVSLRQTDRQLNLSESFKFPMVKFLRLLYSLLQTAPSVILCIIESLLSLFPQLAIEEPTFKLLLELLMHAVRLSASDITHTMDITNEKMDRTDCSSSSVISQQQQPAVQSLHLLTKLTDIWEQAELPSDRLADMMNQLFDLLRVFPGNLEHAEVRLRVWWHFICRLPTELLTDGFRRFVSPFLANMLGRYLSISAPLGDPQLHRYKLSQGNAYEGNQSALELAQHVFACFFQSPLVNLKRLDGVPSPRMEDGILAYNSYQLLVALLYWLRLLCDREMLGGSESLLSESSPSYLPIQPVDQIWMGSIQRVLEASTCLAQPNTELPLPPSTLRSPSVGARESQSVPLMVLQHAISTTCHLISPTTTQLVDQRSSDLSPTECLNILEATTELTMKHPIPDSDRMDLLFDLCVKAMEIGNTWILSRPGSSIQSKLTSQDILNRWCELTIRLIESDKRLDVAGSAIPRSWTIGTGSTTGVGSGGELIPLVHQLLLALIPDCVHLAAANLSNTDLTSQDSSMSVWLGQSPTIRYSPEGLRVWSVLADHFARFILIEQRVCEGDPISSPDLTTVQAALLGAFWFAGPTPGPQADSAELACGRDSGDGVGKHDIVEPESSLGYLSSKDELAVAKRLATLFAAFHQEACLFTTVATNSWIDQLGHKLVTLISAIMPNATSHLNFNLLGRFIRCLAQNAERVHEEVDNKATFNPFSWKSTQDRPFGHLTGLVLALRLCLLNSPWFDPPSPSKDTRSPKRGRRASSVIRILASPPPLAHMAIRSGASQESRPLDDEASVSSQLTQSQSNLLERIEASGFRVSCGLIEALEAVTILVKDHVRTSDMVSWMVETLSPALLRLATSCAKAEAAVQDAATELDEPLLITQRRQQAKLALEEIFLSLFKWAEVQPIVFPEHDLASVLHLATGKRRIKEEDSGVSNKLPHIAGLLRPVLALCGVSINPVQRLPTKVGTHSGRGFLPWLVGFWNTLQDTCPLSSNSKSKTSWDRHLLNEVRSILKDYEHPLVQLLHSLDKTDSTLPAKSRRSSSVRSLRKPRIKQEEIKQADLQEQVAQSCPRLSNSSRLKQDDVEGDLSLATLKQELSGSRAFSTTPTPSPPTRGRGRRTGRLSLNRRPIEKEELNTTPVRRMSMLTGEELLTRSAPSGLTGRRRGRGRLPSSFARSPQQHQPESPHTPRGGILATALGLQPSMGFNDAHSPWSPVKGSPGPLPGKPLIKRRLFPGIADEPGGCKSLATSESATLPGSRRKRRYSDSEPSDTGSGRKPPVLADFEESAQFVFIPPKNESSFKRRRTLTAHQKERFDEQKQDYLPVTYTELDTSQQSLLAGGGGSDSQSGSQSQFSQPSWDQFRTALHERHLLTATGRTGDDRPAPTSPTPMESEVLGETPLPPTESVASDAISSTSSTKPEIPQGSESPESKISFSPVTSLTSESTEQPIEKDKQNEVVAKGLTSPVSTDPGCTASPSNSCSSKVTTPPLEQASPRLTSKSRDPETPPNTPQTGTAMTTLEMSANTTPTSYLNRLSGSRTAMELNVPIPPSLNLNRTSPLIRNIGSSRAQRMLALGLQRAAQQTARQKSAPDVSSSETNSPEHSVSSSPPVSYRRSVPPEQSASPSGIMRNLWSRKKAQRVSFAEQPVVFTFGNSYQSHQHNEENGHNTQDKLGATSPSPPSILKDITGSAVNLTPHAVAVDSEGVSKPDTKILTVAESPPSQIAEPERLVSTNPSEDTKPNLNNSVLRNVLLTLPMITRVDLDASQSSQDGTPISFKHPDPHSNHLCESESQRRPRKSNSPQRRVIVVRPTSSSSAGRKALPKAIMVTPGGRRIKMPKRRRLFTTEDSSPQSPDAADDITSVPDSIVPDTESDEFPQAPGTHDETLTSTTRSTSTDSEAMMMIADTQEADAECASQSSEPVNLDVVLSPDSSPPNHHDQDDVDVVGTQNECVLIESSQGSDFSQPEENSPPERPLNDKRETSEKESSTLSTFVPDRLESTAKATLSTPTSSMLSLENEKISTPKQADQPVCSPNAAQDTDGETSHPGLPASQEPGPEAMDTCEQKEPVTLDGPGDQSSEEHDDEKDVEAEIREKLSQIAAQLADLPRIRHQAILMDVLSTFKPIMH